MSTGAREQLDNEQFERMQQRIAKLEQQLQSCPFLVGTRRDVTLGTATTTVPHGLGRTPKGVLILSSKPGAYVGLSATQPTDTKNFANVSASATTSASLWFF